MTLQALLRVFALAYSLIFLVPATTHAVTDIFARFDGIDGESQDERHEDWVDVLAISQGVWRTGQLHSGGGGGEARALFTPISLTKYIDKASVDLFLHAANGSSINEVTIEFVTSGEKPTVFFEIVLSGVVISSVRQAAAGGQDAPAEVVTLEFSEVQWCYTEVDDRGGIRRRICQGWDLEKNART